MIARHETHLDKVDIWSALSAPLPPGVISWRQDGRTVNRDGRHIARFVAYIEANTVRERLDAVVPGEWDLTLELLPAVTGLDEDANQGACSFKARLQILGVIREDVGTGKDYKQAATVQVPVTAELELPASGPLATEEQSCPKCGGRTWDNRLTKRNPKAPDFKCRDRSCDGVVWPPRGAGKGGTDDP